MSDESNIERIAEKAKKICGPTARLGMHMTPDKPKSEDPNAPKEVRTEDWYWTLNIGPLDARITLTEQPRLDQIESFLNAYKA